MSCALDGPCRKLASLPGIDAAGLPPAQDRVAYLSWLPELRVEVLTLATGARRTLSESRDCRPRWRGDRVWVARGGPARFEWVEFEGASGRPTGASVPGRGACGAESDGPDGVLETRVRVRHREVSDLLVLPRP